MMQESFGKDFNMKGGGSRQPNGENYFFSAEFLGIRFHFQPALVDVLVRLLLK